VKIFIPAPHNILHPLTPAASSNKLNSASLFDRLRWTSPVRYTATFFFALNAGDFTKMFPIQKVDVCVDFP